MLGIERLEDRCLCSVSPFDVNGDGRITPQDVLVEIGNANAGQAAPIDVLRIINYINAYGSDTQAEFAIVGTLPAGETLGKLQYAAARPTAVEITIFAQGNAVFPEIENPVFVDSLTGEETIGIRSQPGTGIPRWTFKAVVAGTGVLEMRGTVAELPATVWGMTTFWDTRSNRPLAKGLELARLL